MFTLRHMCPHTTICVSALLYVSSYYYIRVLILLLTKYVSSYYCWLHMCPHTTYMYAAASSYCVTLWGGAGVTLWGGGGVTLWGGHSCVLILLLTTYVSSYYC